MGDKKDKKILHEIYKKLILSLTTLDVELKQTRKIHDMIRGEFASIFTKFCFSQDREFFSNWQDEKDKREQEEREKQKEWEQKQAESSTSSCGINDDAEKDNVEEEDVEVAPKEEKPKDVKKLYRKIAVVTHPDKNERLDEGEEKDHLVALYKEATQAYNDSDMSTLIRIAVELGIKTPDPNEEQMQVLHDKVKDVKIDIATIENTEACVWYYSNENERAYLMQKHYEYVRGKNK